MVLFALVVARLLWLQVIDAPNLSAKAQSLHTTNVTLTAKRGTIYDRNGNVLATSVECRTIYCNPKEVTNKPTCAQELANALGGSADHLRLCAAQDRHRCGRGPPLHAL